MDMKDVSDVAGHDAPQLQASIDKSVLASMAQWLEQLQESPAWFLDPSAEEAQSAASEARRLLKLFGDMADQCSSKEQSQTEEGGIVVDNFDKEQIWEEMDMRNVPLRRRLRLRLSRLAKAPRGAIDLSLGGTAPAADLDREVEAPPVAKPAKATVAAKKKQKKDLVDDGEKDGPKLSGKPKAEKDKTPSDFFSFDDMDKFLDLADAGKVRLDDDAGSDDFALLEGADVGDSDDDDDDVGDDAKDVMFSDFFGATPREGGEKLEDGDEDEDLASTEDDAAPGGSEDEDDEALSEEEQALELQLQKLQDKEKDGADSEDAGDVDDEGEEEEDDDAGDKIAERDDGDTRGRSLYEMDRRLTSLEDEVAKLEEDQLADKNWSMKGEVSSRQRPMNSLLEVHLDQPMSAFAGRRAEDTAAVAMNGDALDADGSGVADAADDVAKPARHFDVDRIIQNRIWDETFDDVVKRSMLPPSQRPQEKDEDVVEALNFEKSRIGLGDIYAKQFETQVFGAKTDAEQKEDKEKTETKALFAKLMFKLDLLTNAHFTPRPPMLGMAGDQVAKVPSIKMEETIPLMVSQSSAKAPEELRAPRRHDRESAELSHEERTAVRRTKKAKRRKQLEKKLDEGAMTLGSMRDRARHLTEKNAAEKEKQKLASKGVIKEQKKRLKASELLTQAAETLSTGASRKEEIKKQRQVRSADAPTSKRLKL